MSEREDILLKYGADIDARFADMKKFMGQSNDE